MKPIHELPTLYASMLEDGDIEAIELRERLDRIKSEKREKYANLGRLIKNLDAYSEALNNEIKTLKARKDAADNRIQSIKDYLDFIMPEGEKFDDGIVRISRRTTKSIEVPDEDLVPDAYCKFERRVMKKELEADMKISGQNLPFARIVEKKSIWVR